MPYEDRPITSGILAGMKMAALAEELKVSRLERAEFEANAEHRQTMAMLAEEQARAANNLTALQSETQKLNQQILQEQLAQEKAQGPLKTVGLGLQNILAGTQIAGEKQRQRLEEKADKRADALTGSELKKNRSLTKESESRTRENVARAALLEKELAGGVGQAAGEVGFDDYVTLAKNALEANGVKFKEGDAVHQLWTLQIKAAAEGMQREIADNTAVNTLNRQAAVASQAENLAGLALRTSDPQGMFEVFAEEFKDNPILVATARGLVERGLISRKEAETGSELSAAQERNLAPAYEQQIVLKSQIDRLRSKGTLDATEERELRQLESRFNAMERYIASLREGLAPKRNRDSRAPSVLSILPDSIINLTDADLPRMIEGLKARGINVTEKQLKDEIARRKARS